MRARGVKPGFFTNEVLASSEPLNQVIFEGLWCLADREGRLEDRPPRIHVQINPYRAMSGTVQALCFLDEKGFIRRYKGADGTPLIQVLTFSKHQNPHVREAPSRLPPFGAAAADGTWPAPGEHSAESSTVLAPGQHQSSPADSLFSDSGLLTRSSLTPDPLPPSPSPARGGNGASAPSEEEQTRRPRSIRAKSRQAWAVVLPAVQQGLTTVGDPTIDEAVRLMGGYQRLGQSQEAQRDQNMARFRETYERLLERGAV